MPVIYFTRMWERNPVYDVVTASKLIEEGLAPEYEDGRFYAVQVFQGGYLLDGCPLNRILYGGYSTGQKEALDNAGIVCYLDPPPEPPAEPPPTPAPQPPPAVPPPSNAETIPDIPVQPIILVPTGEPVSTGVISAVATIIGAIIGIFKSGLPKSVAKELVSLRDAVVQLGKELLRLSQILAWGIQAVLRALETLWEKVIRPVLNQIEQINRRIGAILDRVLKPYLDLLQRIRQIILDVYGRIFLPIISAIQQIRQMLALLRILKVPGVKALDEKLQQIQGKLIGVITDLLRATNDHTGLLNTLLTLRMTLQHGVFIGSMFERSGDWISLWWNEQTPKSGNDAPISGTAPPIEAAAAKATQDSVTYATTGAGPLAALITRGTETFHRTANTMKGPIV